MNRRCSQPHCFAPDVACHLGEDHPNECAAWQGAASVPEYKDGSEIPPGELLLPWSGNSLGSDDLPFVTGRSGPKVVGIVGPQNAGKTTLLAAWFLLLGRGTYRMKSHRFAGSYSLGSWEGIAHALRWAGDGGPAFPPHTPSGGGRSPGLLHLGLRHRGGNLEDILCADAPGEWFRRWALDREAVGAAGARWIGEHADVFLLVADSESLSGPQRGVARGDLVMLARRLGAERRDRPVAIVWTKVDLSVPPEIRSTIRDVVGREIPDADEFAVSVHASGAGGEAGARDPGPGFLALLDWVITARRPPLDLRRPATTTADPFLAYGRS